MKPFRVVMDAIDFSAPFLVRVEQYAAGFPLQHESFEGVRLRVICIKNLMRALALTYTGTGVSSPRCLGRWKSG